MINKGPRAGLILALVIFVADQLTKYIVTGPLGIDAPGRSMELLPFFDLTYVQNFGVSLGMLAATSDTMRWALVALTCAISVGVVVWMWRETNRVDVLALGAVLGGALGNIVDRIRFGHVVDFADLHFGEFRPFLIFNVGDAAITIGVVVLLLRAFFAREPKAESVDA